MAGLGGINGDAFDTNSTTHSLQINVRRNMTRHLSYTLAYNFAKTWNIYGNSGNGTVTTHDADFGDKVRNWGPQYLPAPRPFPPATLMKFRTWASGGTQNFWAW